MGSALGLVLAGVGAFSVGLGVAHVAIPALLRYSSAIGVEATHGRVGGLGLGPLRYELRRSDLVGVTWIMSNAASYVLVTAGIVDLAWATGVAVVPIHPVAWWLAGWWAIRAAGQLALGRRPIDLALLNWFAALAVVHVVVALAPD